MGFDLGSALQGGGVGFMAGGPVGALIGAGAGGLIGGRGDYETTSQVPLETPEEREARQLLLNYARTGQMENIVAGEGIDIGTSGYNMTDIERSGLDRLSALVSSGQPGEFDMAGNALRDIFETSDAMVDKQFEPFRARATRELRGASDRVKRRNAIQGNLYGTQTIRDLGDVEARGQEVMLEKLAGLTNEAMNRRLAAVPQAVNLAAAREGVDMGRIGASQTYGSLERLLSGAREEAEREEALRQRGEVMSRINALSAIRSPEFGIPSVETYQPSSFERLLGITANVGGQVLPYMIGRQAGGATAGGI